MVQLYNGKGVLKGVGGSLEDLPVLCNNNYTIIKWCVVGRFEGSFVLRTNKGDEIYFSREQVIKLASKGGVSNAVCENGELKV